MATFINQATLSYNGISTTSNITTGEIVEVISASKTAVSTSYTGEGTVSYIVNIVNSGATAYNGISVTDDLGAYAFGEDTLVPLDYVAGSLKYFINGVPQTTPPTVEAGPPLVISGINIPADSNATVVYEAAVNDYAPLEEGSSIANTATIDAPGLTAPVTVADSVPVGSFSDLTISKAVSPSIVVENGQVTYTFVIQNSGNAEVTEAMNATVTDVFSPVLSNITVTLNGMPLVSPDGYTYDETTGAFATVPGVITVPAATYQQDATTGLWVLTPGVRTLAVTGTI